MAEKRRSSPKRLTRKGFLNSEAVAHAKSQWGYSKSHAKILAEILKNWLSHSPVHIANFDATHVRYSEELSHLTVHAIKADGDVYRPTGYGIALMSVLSVPGTFVFASTCAKAYDLLRAAYFKCPRNPAIALSEFQKLLNLNDDASSKVLLVLNDLSIATHTIIDAEARICIAAQIKDKADIWALFERMMSGYIVSAPSLNGVDSLSSFTAEVGVSEDRDIGMCPAALADWKKAHERLMRDPTGAITSARAMLESAIKWIHHQRNAAPPSNDGSTGRHVKDCLKLLGGEGGDFEKPGVSTMVRGMETAINGLVEARNAMGDGHGKSPDAPHASLRIARLVVGLATTVTSFLLATYESRQRP